MEMIVTNWLGGYHHDINRAYSHQRRFMSIAGHFRILALALAVLVADPLFAQPKPKLSVEELIAERDRLDEQSRSLLKAGKPDKAIPLIESKLQFDRELLVGVIRDLPDRKDLHASFREILLTTLEFLAYRHRLRDDLGKALKLRREIVPHKEKLHGKSDWRVTDARLDVSDLEKLTQLTRQQRSELSKAVILNRRVLQHHRDGKAAAALPLAQQVLQIRTKLLGKEHRDTATSYNNLALIYRNTGDYAKAKPLYQKSLDIFSDVLGRWHPQTATSLRNLGDLHRLSGDFAKALSLTRQALEIDKKVFGLEHPSTALSLNNLGLVYYSMGDFIKSEPCYLQSLEIYNKVPTREHRRRALLLNNLGLLYSAMGDYAKAEPHLLNCMEIQNKVLGKEHPDMALSLNNLGLLYSSMGDYAKAESLYQKALEIHKLTFGKEHPRTAVSLNNLGLLYSSMGDHVQAESLHRQALEIRKKTLGNDHPSTANSINNLATQFQFLGNFYKAEPLYQKSLEIYKKTVGNEHPNTANSLGNLASLYESMGEFTKAETLYQQSLAIRSKVLGESHSSTAGSISNLAVLYLKMGNYVKAEPHLKKSLEIHRKVLGQDHPDTATSLNNYGFLYRATSNFVKAESLYRQSLSNTANLLERTSLVQSERQQLAMGQSLRFQLDSYLSCALEAEQFGEQAFRQVLAWKGATLVRQRQLRKVADQNEIAPLFAKLQQTVTRLSTLALRVPEPKQRAVWNRQIDELTAEKERLEVELSKKSAAFRETKKRITLEMLLKALPKDTALIDFLEYDRSTLDNQKKGKIQFERSLVAFVIQKGKAVELIDLGPVQPVGKEIDVWRKAFDTTAEGRAAGLSLRKRIWQPLEAILSGAKTILVSPDGVLGRLPLPALPGKTKGKYLLEEYRIATIPVPQLLPALMNQRAGKKLEGGLLLMGDVDYDADPQAVPKKRRKSWQKNRSTAMVRGTHSFAHLEATAGEIATIKELFTDLFEPSGDEIKTLAKLQATEAGFREAAPGYYNLHIATHGFFADPTKKSALATDPALRQQQLSQQRVTGHHPGLLSGLAFAGANRKHEPDKDDGILTAEEIVTIGLDGCDLVVLSACETGLGEVAGGEGLLGVQRAFQVSGARSTIASLWSVDDLATRRLMERFYRNYWDKEMSKLDALREAQIWLLNHPEQVRDARRKPKLSDPQRVSPHYWAAFLLSGDWR